MAVDSTRAARGKRSLHITRASAGASLMRETRTLPATNGAYYGRVFLWIDQWPTSNFVHYSLAIGYSGGTAVRMGGQFQTGRLKYLFNIQPPAQGPPETGLVDYVDPVPVKTWQCIEWSMDSTKGEMRMWVDGKELTRLHWLTQFPVLSSLAIGWEQYQSGTPAYDVWIDEIAIADSRIGCQD
jgi:hypothetical protein